MSNVTREELMKYKGVVFGLMPDEVRKVIESFNGTEPVLFMCSYRQAWEATDKNIKHSYGYAYFPTDEQLDAYYNKSKFEVGSVWYSP